MMDVTKILDSLSPFQKIEYDKRLDAIVVKIVTENRIKLDEIYMVYYHLDLGNDVYFGIALMFTKDITGKINYKVDHIRVFDNECEYLEHKKETEVSF